MKIKETIERDCCAMKDLKPYKGIVKNKTWANNVKPMFCVHCGQIWIHTKSMGLAGSMETDIEKVEI